MIISTFALTRVVANEVMSSHRAVIILNMRPQLLNSNSWYAEMSRNRSLYTRQLFKKQAEEFHAIRMNDLLSE